MFADGDTTWFELSFPVSWLVYKMREPLTCWKACRRSASTSPAGLFMALSIYGGISR